MDRNEVIKRIRAALKKRSGRSWSVTGGRGTAWGWIKINAPPARCRYDWTGTMGVGSGHSPSLADRNELANLLGKEGPMHPQGESIPASSAYYQEYVDRAEGRTPSVIGTQYWD